MQNLVLFATNVANNSWGLNHSLFFFLYLGPETVMPIASILATIVGFLLVFWRIIWRGVKKLIRLIRRQPEENSNAPEAQVSVEPGDEKPTLM